MTDSDPMPKLMQFVSQELIHSQTGELADDEDLLGGGHIDSMGIMRLVAFLETDFGVTVPPEDVTIENFETLGTICDYIRFAQSKMG